MTISLKLSFLIFKYKHLHNNDPLLHSFQYIITSLLIIPQDMKWTCQKLWTPTQWQGCSSCTLGSRGFQWYPVDKPSPVSHRLSRIRMWECLRAIEHCCACIINPSVQIFYHHCIHCTGWNCAWIDQQHWCFPHCHAQDCCRATVNGEAYYGL